MAFGAVATGSIKAQLALITAGIMISAGGISSFTATAAKIGINNVVVAVLLVISVRKVTNRHNKAISRKIFPGRTLENPSDRSCPKPEVVNALQL